MGSATTALVADDNIDAALTLSVVLELLGYSVLTAHDGLEAVEIAEQARPGLIFLDLGMPGLNGWQACERIRSMTWAHLPAIFAVSGYGTDEAKKRSRRAGFDAHCVKPLDLKTVKNLITKVTGLA